MLMNTRIISFVGGIVAGFSLLRVPLVDTLSSLDPILDVIGVLSVIVFSGGLIYTGIKTIINKRIIPFKRKDKY